MTALHGGGFLHERKPTALQRVGSSARGIAARVRSSKLPNEDGFERDMYPFDQVDESSCAGHFVAQSGHLILGELWSPQFPYYYARLLEFRDPDKVEDIGARLSTLATACAKHGVCSFAMWNRRLSGYDVNLMPPATARIAAQKKLVDIRPILAFGDALVERVCDSIHRRQPVGIVVAIDKAFDEGRGVIGGTSGPVRGLHVVTGVQYRTRRDGRREVRIANSWSRDYGDNGGVWLSPERVGESPYTVFVRSIRSAA